MSCSPYSLHAKVARISTVITMISVVCILHSLLSSCCSTKYFVGSRDARLALRCNRKVLDTKGPTARRTTDSIANTPPNLKNNQPALGFVKFLAQSTMPKSISSSLQCSSSLERPDLAQSGHARGYWGIAQQTRHLADTIIHNLLLNHCLSGNEVRSSPVFKQQAHYIGVSLFTIPAIVLPRCGGWRGGPS